MIIVKTTNGDEFINDATVNRVAHNRDTHTRKGSSSYIRLLPFHIKLGTLHKKAGKRARKSTFIEK